MKKTSILLLLSLLSGLAASQGGEFWQKKEYRQWSERECRKLLENSPWARTHIISRVVIEPIASEQNTGRGRESNQQISYQVQLRSALPIRQALVRLQQLNAKYDVMPPEQKQAFDQKAELFLAGRLADAVVVHVTYSSNVAVDDRELARYWQTQTTETLKNFVFLIASKGDKVPLSRYTATTGAGREFQLVFPREYQGHPLVSAQDKAVKLEFAHPRINGQSESRVLLEFKVERMLVEGAVVY